MTFLPEAFIQSPLFGIALTIVVYVICEIIVDKFELSIIPPFVVCVGVPDDNCLYLFSGAVYYIRGLRNRRRLYQLSARPCHRGAGPAAVQQQAHYKRKPAGNYKRHSCCHRYRHSQHLHLRQNVRRKQPGAAFQFGASSQVLLSMIPKSVTTPIAMDISSAIGGIPALTAACVIFTGMLGATFNHKILEALKIKNNIAIGLSI